MRGLPRSSNRLANSRRMSGPQRWSFGGCWHGRISAGRETMAQILFDFPPSVFSALRRSPEEFAREMRLAAAIHWYSQEQISQGKAAEIAGISRAEFLDELFRRRIPALQVTLEEVREELAREP